MSIYQENTLKKEIKRDIGVTLKLPLKEKTEYLTFGIVEISPEKNTTSHSHDIGEEFMSVIEGEGLIILDEKKHEVKKGDLIFIKSHQKHQIINVSKKEYLKLLIGVSPPLDF